MVLPNVTIVALWSSKGQFAFGYGSGMLVNHWAQHLTHKANTDPTWPFRANVELIDYESNVSFVTHYLIRRLTQLPPVSAIMAPEGPVGTALSAMVSKYNIPYILTFSSPDPIIYSLPVNDTSSFYMQAPDMYKFEAVMDLYERIGVQTIATVVYMDSYDGGYNYWSCYGAAQYLGVPRGLSHIGHFELYSNSTQKNVHEIAFSLKTLDPDAILWCDWQSITFGDDTSTSRFGPLALQHVNYMPKSLTMLDVYGASQTHAFIDQELVDFVLQSTFTHNSLHGQAYTEDLNPYGTVFRPEGPMTTVIEAINVGSSKTSPSSVQLFNAWYKNKTGYFPQYQSNGYWAALELLEGAIYRVTQNKHMMQHGTIDPIDIVAMLMHAQASGTYGRVIFDAHRVNTPATTVAVQLYPGEKVPYIVSPSSLSEVELIYPMPSWDERKYIWRLTKDHNFVSAVVLASLCSSLLVAIIITLLLHHHESDIRMLHAPHMISICGASMIAIWSCVLVWQSDMNMIQCRMYLWFTYLPVSFVLAVVNMKAYRLSVFLHSDNKHRLKRLNHPRMLLLALGWTSLTFLVLFMISLLDTPILLTNIIDPHRPIKDIHTCDWHPASSAMILVTVITHAVGSMGSVISVRNGTGEFRDGMVFKEAFVIFWFCVVIAYMIQLLGLDSSTTYVVRSSFLSIGITLFCFRILVNRVYRHWVPIVVVLLVNKLWSKITSFVPASHRKQSTSVSMLELDLEGPGYTNEIPDAHLLEDMYNVLKDPEQAETFRAYANKALVVENVDFMLAIQDYRQKSAELLMETTKRSNDQMKTLAMECFANYIQVNSANEVNVCSATREKTLEMLHQWNEQTVLMDIETAKMALDDDPKNRVDIFERAYKEIGIMLFQNIWNKYRAVQIETSMS